MLEQTPVHARNFGRVFHPLPHHDTFLSQLPLISEEMARGVVSRSQRQASGSQSQPAYTQNGRSQTQRNGRSRRVEEEEEEEQDAEDDEDAMDEDEDEEGPGDDVSSQTRLRRDTRGCVLSSPDALLHVGHGQKGE